MVVPLFERGILQRATGAVNHLVCDQLLWAMTETRESPAEAEQRFANRWEEVRKYFPQFGSKIQEFQDALQRGWIATAWKNTSLREEHTNMYFENVSESAAKFLLFSVLLAREVEPSGWYNMINSEKYLETLSEGLGITDFTSEAAFNLTPNHIVEKILDGKLGLDNPNFPKEE